MVNGGAWDMGNRVGPTGRVVRGTLDFQECECIDVDVYAVVWGPPIADHGMLISSSSCPLSPLLIMILNMVPLSHTSASLGLKKTCTNI